jgi:site-specific DNA recombinase
MRVVTYSRVSTTEQRDHGVSLDAQEAKTSGYAALYDLEVVAVIRDAGESGKNLKRPGLQRALTMLRNGEADGLVIAKLDRLTRHVGDWQALITDYFNERSGKQLFAVADSIDTRSAGGRLVLNMLLSVAQWEREIIAERTRAALRYKISIGERAGRLPYGWDVADDGKTLILNATEQAGLAMMRQLRGEGRKLREIEAAMNEAGFRTKHGKPLNFATISRILKRQSSDAA